MKSKDGREISRRGLDPLKFKEVESPEEIHRSLGCCPPAVPIEDGVGKSTMASPQAKQYNRHRRPDVSNSVLRRGAQLQTSSILSGTRLTSTEISPLKVTLSTSVAALPSGMWPPLFLVSLSADEATRVLVHDM